MSKIQAKGQNGHFGNGLNDTKDKTVIVSSPTFIQRAKKHEKRRRERCNSHFSFFF